MKSVSSYALQRHILCLRLQTNRQLLVNNSRERQLATADDAFPRSLTMRLLTRTPGISTLILAEIVPFLLGRYLAKTKSGS